ncbi:MAG: hypothetical protein HQL52_18900 [Magnetococcales bacterium]|nr:hypothetical protein [Magnetococcales bacterium]
MQVNLAKTRARLDMLKLFPTIYAELLAKFDVEELTNLDALLQEQRKRLQFFVNYYYKRVVPQPSPWH